MPKLIVPLATIVLIGLAGCSQKAQNELGQAGNTMAGDSSATMAKADNSVDAAADKAFGAAENSMDRVGNASEAARRKAGEAAKDIGNDIED